MLAQKHFQSSLFLAKNVHRVMTGNRAAVELNFVSVPRLAPRTYLWCRKVSEIISPLNPCDFAVNIVSGTFEERTGQKKVKPH